MALEWKVFSEEEHKTWTLLYNNLDHSRLHQAVPEFISGLKKLNINPTRIPDLEEINRILGKETGWEGVPVVGLEEGESFFPMLAKKKYPVGNFIRDAKDLSYTPAPDVFHDLYGHVPFFVDKDYAEFCQKYGQLASKYVDDKEAMEKLGRFFWFTIEFALLETPVGRRIFGAGILSSFSECNYSLSSEPKTFAFHLENIFAQSYRADQLQDKLFVLKERKDLYQCLDKVEALLDTKK